jgi:hypothetical protein
MPEVAWITVTDAAGRILFRRPATPAEVIAARQAAGEADAAAQDVMDRIAAERHAEAAREPKA